MNRITIRPGLVAIFVAVTAHIPVAAQSTQDCQTAGRITWRNVPGASGALSGTVVGPAGVPMAGASVQLGKYGDLLTDRHGRFETTLPASAEVDLTVISVGYRAARGKLTIPSASGTDVSVYLPLAALDEPVMVCLGRSCDDLHIVVVDSLSGKVPLATATLRLQHGDSTWQREVALAPGHTPDGAIGLGRTITSTGLHTIEVLVPGYHPWRVANVDMRLEGCFNVLRNRVHTARLVPKRT
jgi:hypothetical protein